MSRPKGGEGASDCRIVACSMCYVESLSQRFHIWKVACVCGKYLECYLIAVVIRTRTPRSAIVHAYAGALERLAVTAT